MRGLDKYYGQSSIAYNKRERAFLAGRDQRVTSDDS